jgi:hypothetical protein
VKPVRFRAAGLWCDPGAVGVPGCTVATAAVPRRRFPAMGTEPRPRRRFLVLLVLVHVAILAIGLAMLWPLVGSLAGPAAEGVTARLAAAAGLVVVLLALGFGARSSRER